MGKVGRVVRAVRVASLPVGAAVLAVQGLALRAAGHDPEQVRLRQRRRNAARTRSVLGGARGGALKAGQLLATVEALFPADPDGTWREALIGMTGTVDALPWPRVEPVLRQELGDGWRDVLPHMEITAAAAASLGQVHRGRWHDGRDVAVKVQYPDVAADLRSDLRLVQVATQAAALVARGLALPPLVSEMRRRLVEELDYVHEGDAQQAFADAYAGDPDVAVPGVVLATARVLVTEWMPGRPIADVAHDTSTAQPTRDLIGERYQRFLLSGPARAGRLHTDPHPGNFLVTDDGRLGVLDFGSTLAMPDGMPSTFGRLIAALLDGDAGRVERRLREEGFVRPGARPDVAKLTSYLAPFTVPARQERFTFTPEWLKGQFGRVGDPRDPDFAVALQLTLPPEHLFTQRVWLGVVGVLCQLRATVPVGPELRRWLPGFEV